jgi:quercetin dioxygenase-like cupin family protein
MKRLFLVLALLLSASLLAQAPEPVPLAHGNTPGEPHHHLNIENEYVRVYYVEVPPHENTELHQHDYDYLFVTLGNSDVINAVRDKPEVHLVLKDGETHFTRGGFAHVARNLSDAPFRNVTIELLKAQGDAHNLCSQFVLSDPIGPCNKAVLEGHMLEPQFDTSGISVDLLRFSPKTTIAETTMKAPVLIASLRNSGIKIAAKGKAAKTLHAGEIAWFEAGSSIQFSNSVSKSATFMQITFIDAGARQASN